jgi:hypothetical protein
LKPSSTARRSIYAADADGGAPVVLTDATAASPSAWLRRVTGATFVDLEVRLAVPPS